MRKTTYIIVCCLLAACAGTQSGKHVDKRQQAWKRIVAKPERAVSLAVDRQGQLWRARAHQGHVLVSKSTDEGKTFLGETRVNNEKEAVAANGENRPKLAFGSNNEIYVSWTRLGSKPFSGDVRFSRSIDGGGSYSTPVTINSDRNETSHRFDSLIADHNGRVWLFWLDKRDKLKAKRASRPYKGAAVYYAYSDDGGSTFSDNRKLQDNSCQCCRIALGITGKSVPVVVWRQIFKGGERDHALQYVDGRSPMVRLSREHWKINACPHHGPSLVIDHRDVVHSVWFSGAAGRDGLYYAQSRRHGDNIRTSAPLKFSESKSQAGHASIYGTRSKLVVAWKAFHNGHSVVRIMQSYDAGKHWQKPRNLLKTAGASDHPLVTGNHEKIFLSWNTDKEGLHIIPLHKQ